MQRIKNSIRVEPNRLKEELLALREFMEPECEIYLYCSCVRETTSARVAHMLQQENCRTQVIKGGMKALGEGGGQGGDGSGERCGAPAQVRIVDAEEVRSPA